MSRPQRVDLTIPVIDLTMEEMPNDYVDLTGDSDAEAVPTRRGVAASSATNPHQARSDIRSGTYDHPPRSRHLDTFPGGTEDDPLTIAEDNPPPRHAFKNTLPALSSSRLRDPTTSLRQQPPPSLSKPPSRRKQPPIQGPTGLLRQASKGQGGTDAQRSIASDQDVVNEGQPPARPDQTRTDAQRGSEASHASPKHARQPTSTSDHETPGSPRRGATTTASPPTKEQLRPERDVDTAASSDPGLENIGTTGSSIDKTPQPEVTLPSAEDPYVDIFEETSSDDEQDSDDEDASTEAIPQLEKSLQLEVFEDILRDMSRQIDDANEYIVKHHLRQGRLAAQLRSTSAIPQPKTNPFAAMKCIATTNAIDRDTPHVLYETKSFVTSGPHTHQSWETIAIPTKREDYVTPNLPRHRSVNPTGVSFLARGMKIGKWYPYDLTDEDTDQKERDEKYSEIRRNFYAYEGKHFASLLGQRACAERVHTWRPWMHKFLKRLNLSAHDMAYYFCLNPEVQGKNLDIGELDEFIKEQEEEICPSCSFRYQPEKQELWKAFKDREVSPRSLMTAMHASSAFQSVAQISMFCVLFKSTEFQQKLADIRREPKHKTIGDSMCLVCTLHHCSLHGAYREKSEAEDEVESDSEPLPKGKPSRKQKEDVEHEEKRASREDVRINDPESVRNVRQLITLPPRAPADMRKPQQRRKPITMPSKGQRKAKPSEKDERPEFFVPCSHEGPCEKNDACTCFQQKRPCEIICGCETSCGRRWKGCKCHSGTKQGCVDDLARCECWKDSRECDPWLCHGCGVLEVLDQANKHDEEMRKGRCRNNRLQLGIPARTFKAPSEVQGYGLFIGEALKKGDYIGEYTGEIINEPEFARRGNLNYLQGAQYLFNINTEQEVDAARFGGKTRYMNNSTDPENINVQGCWLLVNGVHRVRLYAGRDIAAGEELLYDYRYDQSEVEHFWERGKRPPNHIAKMTYFGAKMATQKKQAALRDASDEEEGEEEHEQQEEEEGEWAVEEEEVATAIMRSRPRAMKHAPATHAAEARQRKARQEPKSSESEFSDGGEMDDSEGEGNDYDDDGDDDGDDDDDNDSDSDSDDVVLRKATSRKGTSRNGAKKDGRFGGNAQRKAAATRAKRAAAGERY
jgi:hypothetical protein